MIQTTPVQLGYRPSNITYLADVWQVELWMRSVSSFESLTAVVLLVDINIPYNKMQMGPTFV